MSKEKDTLHIIWINNDPVTVRLMVFMYAVNSLRKGWWKNVHVIVWGGATKLLSENIEIQARVREFQEAGGDVSACLRCAEELGVVDTLQALGGIDLFYVGEHVTRLIKNGEHLITL